MKNTSTYPTKNLIWMRILRPTSNKSNNSPINFTKTKQNKIIPNKNSSFNLKINTKIIHQTQKCILMSLRISFNLSGSLVSLIDCIMKPWFDKKNKKEKKKKSKKISTAKDLQALKK